MSTRYRYVLATTVLILVAVVVIKVRGWINFSPTVVATVIVGGHPLEDGSVTFYPMNGDTNASTTGAAIVDGKFEIWDGLSDIEYHIAIQGTIPHPTDWTTAPLSNEKIPMPIQVVPDEYRGRDSLELRKIEPGHNELSFDLPETPESKSIR